MAKKKKIVEEHKSEPVTNCDQSQEPVAKCDQLVKVDANSNHLDSGDIVLSQYDIEKLIITIRGKQVLIDRDLGKIYGVETKRLNFLTDLEKHNTQYDEVKFVQLPHKNHDRFLIIDDSVYLLGASVKDMGNGLCAVTKLQALPETILGMLK